MRPINGQIISQKVHFSNENGQQLAASLESFTEKPAAYGIFAHCFTCSKDLAAASRISRELAARGISILRFDFTGLGGSQGDFANSNFSSNVEDLVCAAEFLKKEHAAPQILIGHSLGGAAVLAAAEKLPEVRAVATIGAPATPDHVSHLFEKDVKEIEAKGEKVVALAGRKFSIKKQFIEDLKGQRQEKRIKNLGKALMIFHSPQDKYVGIDNARKIYELAMHPKSFVSLDKADHLLTRKEDSEYVATVLAAWASRYLLTAEQTAEETARAEGEVTVSEKDHKFLQEIRAGKHTLHADEPKRVGGTDLAPTPYDLLLSALGSCTTMTLRMYARHKKIPLDHVSVTLRHHRIHAQDCETCESDEGMADRIERDLTLVGPGLSAEQRQRLLDIADRCPVHKTLENQKEILTRLV